ncbi:unnamed protein product [Cylindrotheca closterium]|uniref:Uncharacterized protein n=1 Tax=Cylindrotheca closterium TaxID=2856 RepID=A0AAD2G4L1_9STRA|nr:unnamed protein product [Cylindrotheca closterium]
MRGIHLILIAMLLCTCVHGQEFTTATHSKNGPEFTTATHSKNLVVGRKGDNSNVSRRANRGLAKTSNSGKLGTIKGKGGKATSKQKGKSNSNADAADFYGYQQSPPEPNQQQQPSPDDSSEDDSMSGKGGYSVDSDNKISKKSKKSKSLDSYKKSYKLSKKSRSSTSSKGQAPSPSLYPMDPTTAAPTFSPTHDGATDPTSSPTTSGSTHLTPFALEYTVSEDDRIPFRSELLDVVELTRAYLVDYFQNMYMDNMNVTLVEFITVFTDTQSDFGDPIYIAYRSSAVFENADSVLPSIQEVDSQLRQAFLGRSLDGYLGMLQALAPSNIFSTTTFVTQVAVREERQSLSAVASVGIRTKTSANGQNAMAGVAAGVTGITLMGAAGLFYRRQSRTIDHRRSEKYDGDATSFTTGTWSLDHVGLQPMNGGGRHTLT